MGLGFRVQCTRGRGCADVDLTDEERGGGISVACGCVVYGRGGQVCTHIMCTFRLAHSKADNSSLWHEGATLSFANFGSTAPLIDCYESTREDLVWVCPVSRSRVNAIYDHYDQSFCFIAMCFYYYYLAFVSLPCFLVLRETRAPFLMISTINKYKSPCNSNGLLFH